MRKLFVVCAALASGLVQVPGSNKQVKFDAAGRSDQLEPSDHAILLTIDGFKDASEGEGDVEQSAGNDDALTESQEARARAEQSAREAEQRARETDERVQQLENENRRLTALADANLQRALRAEQKVDKLATGENPANREVGVNDGQPAEAIGGVISRPEPDEGVNQPDSETPGAPPAGEPAPGGTQVVGAASETGAEEVTAESTGLTGAAPTDAKAPTVADGANREPAEAEGSRSRKRTTGKP